MAWKKALDEGYQRIEDIIQHFNLSPNEKGKLIEVVSRYPMRVPAYYMSLIDPNDQNDPIRRMCIPDLIEEQNEGILDTSGEAENTVLTGMQHKYRQTVMILSTNQCAMYCRHCFRKRMVGITEEETVSKLPEIVDYIKAHKEINNILISGGDSLMNSNQAIHDYLESFTSIPHIDFIRFGTRMPVVLPQRISEDPELLPLLKKYNEKKQIYIVTQFNHPRELTKESEKAVTLLRQSGCILRNQTVLLKAVNDQPEILAKLFNGLIKIGIIPYYIFQCRSVLGVKNQFQIPLHMGSQIVEQSKSYLSGQAKSVRYVMAHVSGKIEVLGSFGQDKMIFKYHQAKNPKDASRIFIQKVAPNEGFLDNISNEEPY